MAAPLLGLFFMRFDLTTVIVAHFAYNAGLGALPLLRSEEPYFVVSGLVVVTMMLAPVIPGVVGAVWRRLRGEVRGILHPQIRPGTVSDLEVLAALPIEDLDWGALLDDPAAVALCLRAADEVMGVAAGRVAAEGVGEVLAVYVAPLWRRRYWGSSLVDALCVHLQARGAQSVQATAKAGDRIAVAFWASQGWRPAVKVFTRSLAPARRLGWGDVKEGLRTGARAVAPIWPFGSPR